MTLSRLGMSGVALAFALAVAGCGHRLAAGSGESTVKVYPDEATWDKVQELKKQGGPIGSMLGGMGEKFVAAQVDDKTPVNILSRDADGAQVEVSDGPNKGLKGFVAKENVN